MPRHLRTGCRFFASPAEAVERRGAAIGLVAASLLAACSGGAGPTVAPRGDGGVGGPGSMDAASDPPGVHDAAPPDANVAWSMCTSSAASLDEVPLVAELAFPKGTVLRCAPVTDLDATDVDRLARTAGYKGDALATSARVLKLVYRTERGTVPPRAGFGSAVVLWPEKPRAKGLPVIVMAHGTVGEAPACPPGSESPRDPDTYLAELGYALVGAGYAVILPDYAGYAAFGSENNPPPGYHSAQDGSRSVLDAARALRSLEPSLFSSRVVLMGHSLGGHAVLSALAAHESYGSGGELAAVVAYAPSWFPMTSFAGMIALSGSFPLPDEANSVATSVWYHYAQAELLDGPGAGPLLFAADKREGIRKFFEQSCDPEDLADLGANIGELFDAGFATEVAYAASTGLPCVTERCSTWKKRYAADRPHVTGSAKSVPILLVHGDADDWIPPERATCGFDRLEADGANVTFCIVPDAMHDPVVGMRADYVNRWIASLTLGEPDPGVCGPSRDALHDENGQTATCAALPPND